MSISGSITVNVESRNISISLDAESTSVPAGQTDQLTATVTENGELANNCTVTLTDTTTNTSSEAKCTNGIAVFNVTISTPGTYSFVASVDNVQSNTLSITVTGQQTCPCGEVYSTLAGQCVPLVPQQVQWLSSGNPVTSQTEYIGFYAYLTVIDLIAGYFVWHVTMRNNYDISESCPSYANAGGSTKSLGGVINFQVEALDNSGEAIGCENFNISLNNSNLSVVDQAGIKWILSFSVPSSVSANSSGQANVPLSWTLTRSWNGDAPQAGTPPTSANLEFGSLTLTASIPNSTLSQILVLGITAPVCYYVCIGDNCTQV